MKILKTKDLKEFADYLIDFFDTKQDLIKEIKNTMRIFSLDAYHAGAKMVESGCFAVYYDDQRKDLAKIYEQSKEVASLYTDKQVFYKYNALVSRICKIIIEKPQTLGL